VRTLSIGSMVIGEEEISKAERPQRWCVWGCGGGGETIEVHIILARTCGEKKRERWDSSYWVWLGIRGRTLRRTRFKD